VLARQLPYFIEVVNVVVGFICHHGGKMAAVVTRINAIARE
jgi:hypothetical protein